MNMRIISLALLGILLAGGFIASFFTRSIESALTLPVRAQARQSIQHAAPTPRNGTTPGGTNTRNTGQGGQGAQGTNQMPQMPVDILAQDNFQRTDQALWGTASDGRPWDGDANTATSFSIAGNMGQIAHGQGTLNAILGPAVPNNEVLFSGSLSHFKQGKVNIGVVLRWTDGNNWYKALLDGTNLLLLKRVNGVTTQLGSVLFPAQDGVSYSIRFRTVGANLFVKAWQSDMTEPTRWMLVAADMSLTAGQSGIRVLVQNDTVVVVSMFLETAASSGI